MDFVIGPAISAGPELERNSNHYWYFDIDAIARTQRLDVNLVSGNFVTMCFRPITFRNLYLKVHANKYQSHIKCMLN